MYGVIARRKPFVYQRRQVFGWCGPAVLSVGLTAFGLGVSQEELARVAPYDPHWGTDHKAMLVAARRFVAGASEVIGKSLLELSRLAEENVVILNFMDTPPCVEPTYGAGNGQDGHYVLLDRLTRKYVWVVDCDPIELGGGFRRLKRDWFERHFWDIDRGGVVVERWALVIPSRERGGV